MPDSDSQKNKIGWQPVYEGTSVRFIRHEKNLPKKPTMLDVVPQWLKRKLDEESRNNFKPGNKTKQERRGFFATLRNKYSSGLLAGALVMLLVSAPLMLAFEAHVINVTATIFNIDPPTILPPALSCSADVNVTIGNADPDATYIFYNVGSGTDPDTVTDPVCGGPFGGPNPIAPFPLKDDTVVKAIACDGSTGSAHHSQVVTQVYDLSCFGKIEGHKYKDANQNEAFEPNLDFAVEGWRMDLYKNNVLVQTTVTDSNGYYTFNNLVPDIYAVKEEDRPGWIHVSPEISTTTIASTETDTIDFLNQEVVDQCLPQDIIFPLSVALQAAGAISGNDDIAIAANVVVNGSVRSNDELERIGSSAVTRTINGNAVIRNTVDTGFLITSGIISGQPPFALTPVDQTNWKSQAQVGGTVNGSLIFPNSAPALSLGPTEILGNLTLGENNNVTIKGPMYIHGNLTIGTSTTLTEFSGFGDNFVTIIVDGIITINPGVNFVKSGTRGAILLISNAGAVAGDGASINVFADNSNLGDAVLYASDGDVHIGSNRTVLAAFAVHGTGVDTDPNVAVRVDSGAIISYRDLATQISCGPRQPFESTAHVVINEFVPNPGAGKVGTPGGPLDGEWVEIYNSTASPVNVSGYVLYDNTDTNALPITTLNSSTGSTLIPSKGRIVVFRDGDTDFDMNAAGGDTVRLFNTSIGSGGTLVDSHTYTVTVPVDKSFARIPDGSANWVDPDPTPGEPNNFAFEPLETLPDGAPMITMPYLPTIILDGMTEEEIPVSVPPDNSEAPEETESTSAVTVVNVINSGGDGSNTASSTTVIENINDSGGNQNENGTSTSVVNGIPVTNNNDTPTPPEVPKSPIDAREVIEMPLKTEDPQPVTDVAPQPLGDIPPVPPVPDMPNVIDLSQPSTQ